MYLAVGRTTRRLGDRTTARRLACVRSAAGSMEELLLAGLARLAAGTAGIIAAETKQQPLPVQCTGALAAGDRPQFTSMDIDGMGIAALSEGGQQTIVLCLPQAVSPQELSARTGCAETARVRRRATNWSSFFMRCLDHRLPVRTVR